MQCSDQGSGNGLTMLGGGLSTVGELAWNAQAVLSRNAPSDNAWQCAMGGTKQDKACITRACRLPEGSSCITRRVLAQGSAVAALPQDYVMTSGGVENLVTAFEASAGFVESKPLGNAWECLMGIGVPGNFSCVVRGCKVASL